MRSVTVMSVVRTGLSLNRKDKQERRRNKEGLLHGLLQRTLMMWRYKRAPNSVLRGLFLHGCHFAPPEDGPNRRGHEFAIDLRALDPDAPAAHITRRVGKCQGGPMDAASAAVTPVRA